MRPLFLAAVLAALCAPPALSASLIGASWTLLDFPAGLRSRIQGGLFNAVFDQPITLRDSSNGQQKPIGTITNGPGAANALTHAGIGTISVVCNASFSLVAAQPNLLNVMVVHGGEQAMLDVNALLGGLNLPPPSPAPNTSLSLFYFAAATLEGAPLPPTPYSKDFWLACNGGRGPYLEFNGHPLRDISGNEVRGQSAPLAPPLPLPLPCTLDGMQTASAAWNSFQSLVSSGYMAQYSQMTTGVGAAAGTLAWQGCEALLESLWTSQPAETAVLTQACTYPSPSPLHAADPCCNTSLSNRLCCANRIVPKTVRRLQSADEFLIAQHCRSPAAIALLIRDYIDYKNRLPDVSTFNFNGLITRLSGFDADCAAAIGGPCLQDADCPALTSCSLDPYNLRCLTNTPAAAYAHCIAARMPSAVLQEFYAQNPDLPLGPDRRPLNADIAERLINKTVNADCKGPADNAWRAGVSPSPDALGNERLVLVAGNETGCLSEKTCSWDPQANLSACLHPALSNSTCLKCVLDDPASALCFEVSTPPACHYSTDVISTPALCALIPGAVWGSKKGLSYLACHPSDPSRLQTASACRFPGPNQALTAPPACGSTVQCTNSRFCWNTDFAGCPAYPTFYTRSSPFCFWHPSPSLTCTNGNLPGTLFIDADFFPETRADPASCGNGYCSDGTEANASTCAQRFTCSVGCWGCAASRIYLNPATGGTCLFPNVTNSAQCSALSFPSVPGAQGLWVTPEDFCSSPLVNASECVRSGGAFASCAGADPTTCTSGPYQPFLNCAFSQDTRFCANQSACEASLFCEDSRWLVRTVTVGPLSLLITGACFVPAPLSLNGVADCANGLSATYHPARCLVDAILNASACQAISGTWQLPARTVEECETAASFCSVDGRLTAMDAAECALCGNRTTRSLSWRRGTWGPHTTRPFFWQPRAWVSRNAWLPDGSFTAVQHYVQQFVFSAAFRRFNLYANEHYGVLLNLLTTLACDCDAANHSACFNYSVVPLYDSVVTPLRDQEEETSAGAVRGDTEGGQTEGDPGYLRVGKVPLSSVAPLLTGGPGKKRQAGLSYAVVQDIFGNVVGQLAGGGFSLEMEGITSVDATLFSGGDIPLESPALSDIGIAEFDPATGEFHAVNVTARIVPNANGTFTCSLTKGGVYFAAYLLPPGSFPSGPLPSTVAATSSPTIPPTPIPTSPLPSTTPLPATPSIVIVSVGHTLTLSALLLFQALVVAAGLACRS